MGMVPVQKHSGFPGNMTQPILKRASASRPSGQWSEDDFDVLADGDVVGRIFKANAADRYDPVTKMLARLTIEIAKQGKFTAAKLRSRVTAEMTPKKPLNYLSSLSLSSSMGWICCCC
jgi:hypothetical protein